MKLSVYAKKLGISYMTAYRWAKSGKIPNCIIMDTGTILVNDPEVPENEIVSALKSTLIEINELKSSLKDIKTDLKYLKENIKK